MTDEALRLWSVTVLLKHGLGLSDAIVNSAVGKIATSAVKSRRTLDAMIAEQGDDAAIDWLKRRQYQSQNAAKDRGTEIHRAAEALALGQPVSIDAELMPWVEQFKGWLDTYTPRFLMSEAPVYNLTWRYAGTLDGILELGGRRLLYDIKTTERGPGQARHPFPEVALQIVAYARAERVGLIADRRYAAGKRYYVYDPAQQSEPMPEVDGAICIVVSPFDCFAVPVRIDDGVWQTWCACMACARHQLQAAGEIFGPALYSDNGVLEQQLRDSLEVTA